jgi:hypothetical protein
MGRSLARNGCKTKVMVECIILITVSPLMSWLPEPGLSSHEPIPKLSVSWVYFSPGPLGTRIPCLFRSRPSLSQACIDLGLRPLGFLSSAPGLLSLASAFLVWSRRSYFGSSTFLVRPRPSESHVLPHHAPTPSVFTFSCTVFRVA